MELGLNEPPEPPLDPLLHTDLNISHYNDFVVLFVRQGLLVKQQLQILSFCLIK